MATRPESMPTFHDGGSNRRHGDLLPDRTFDQRPGLRLAAGIFDQGRRCRQPPASTLPVGKLAAMVLWGMAVAAVALSGCGGEPKQQGPPPTYRFELQVSVVDEHQAPVAKAPVVIDQNTVAYTDRAGQFKAQLTDREGAQIDLAIGEMDGYLIGDDANATATLELAKTLDGSRAPVPIALDAQVKSARQDYLVWLDIDCGKHLDKSKCQNLSVDLNGDEIRKTDDFGRAHFSFQGVPGHTAIVTLNTPTYKPEEDKSSEQDEDDDDDDDIDKDSFVMEPRKPTYEIELGVDPEILRIDQTFHDPVAAKRAAEKAEQRRRRNARRRRHHHRRHKTKKKDKKKGPIKLF